MFYVFIFLCQFLLIISNEGYRNLLIKNRAKNKKKKKKKKNSISDVHDGVLSFSPRGVLDEILNLIESVSEGFPSYSFSIS